MIGRKISATAVALTACLTALGDAPRALACPSCNRVAPQAATTTYRPFYAPVPTVSQTVNYMPFTGYRTVLMPTPVTSFQPAPACNACGGATTVMRPVTSYALRPQMVPYTSYQPVAVAAYQPVIAAPPACNSCAAAPAVAMYAPAAPVLGVPLVNSQLTTSTGLRPLYSPAAPACGCSAGGPAPAMGMVGASVPSLAASADVAPSLAPGQSFAPGQQIAPGAGPNTTFASPSASLYGGTASFGSGVTSPSTSEPRIITAPPTLSPIPAPGAVYAPAAPMASGPLSTAPLPTTPAIVSPPPPPVTMPAGPDFSAPSSGGSSDAPRKTFKAEKPTDEPKTRLVPKKIYPENGLDSPSDNSGGAGDSGSSGAPASGGSAPNSRETNFDPARNNLRRPPSVNPEDRMTARPIRQATYYRPITAPPVVVSSSSKDGSATLSGAEATGLGTPVAVDDGGWHAARSR